MKRLLLIIFPAIVFYSFSRMNKKEDIVAYRIFDNSGKEVKFTEAAAKLLESDVVFFGELHNNPIAHWMQLQLTKIAYEKMKDKLILGVEMFEADNQLLMDEYLAGKISEKSFEDEARLWPNYKTDYKPLVEFVKDNKLNFVCANVPRRYANIVYKNGVEALMNLSDEAKKYIAPLPFEYDPELRCYKKMKEMSGGHGGDNLPKAQAVKDATMAHFISKHAVKGKTFIHFNGSFHSEYNEGIQWYLNKYKPELKRSSITTVLQKDLSSLEKEYYSASDYIIVVDEEMTGTH